MDALPFSGENNGGLVSSSEGPATKPLVSEIDVTGCELPGPTRLPHFARNKPADAKVFGSRLGPSDRDAQLG